MKHMADNNSDDMPYQSYLGSDNQGFRAGGQDLQVGDTILSMYAKNGVESTHGKFLRLLMGLQYRVQDSQPYRRKGITRVL